MADPAPPAAAGIEVPGTAVDAKDGPIVQMRKFEARDLKEVRLLLGYSVMEQLAAANSFLYTNPFMIVGWLGLASTMITFMSWWPKVDGPAWTWLMPLPALASCAVPLLFAVDWFNRAYFEHLTRQVLAREDTMSIPSYYSSAPGSGFWVLIYKKNPIGLVAVDTYQPESGLKSIEELVKEAEEEQAEKAEKGKKGRKDAKGNKEEKKLLDPSKLGRVPPPTEPTIALVRHFHMDAPYRPTFIQNDLLAHGLSKAFAIPSVHTAYFRVSKLTPWLEEVSKTMGMKKCSGPLGEELAPEVKGSRRGVQGWREWWVGVGREEWEKRYEEMRELHGL